jgi:Ribbon-helix-helix protein, copG family
MAKEEVGPDDVADVVSSWTGIPADRLHGGETGELHAHAQAESVAGRVYDVEIVLRRQPGGRPPLESPAASVEAVRLDPELKRAMLIRAAEEHVSVSEVIRRAIGEYLRTSGWLPTDASRRRARNPSSVGEPERRARSLRRAVCQITARGRGVVAFRARTRRYARHFDRLAVRLGCVPN